MNRRAFALVALGLIVTSKKALATEWATPGKMGYKEVAPENMVKLGKTCDSCGWYNNGFCKFPGIMKNVKPKGICSMWKKKA